MKGLEPPTRNFRRRPTSASTNSSAKQKSCCLLRTLSNSVAQCATRLCYSRTPDRSILLIWTNRSNAMHMGIASCERQGIVHSNADVGKPESFAEDRMDIHENVQLSPKGREQMVGEVVDGRLHSIAELHPPGPRAQRFPLSGHLVLL